MIHVYIYCDALSELKNDQLIPVFYIDYGKKKIPEGGFKDAKEDMMSIMNVAKLNKGVQLVERYEVTPSCWIRTGLPENLLSPTNRM